MNKDEKVVQKTVALLEAVYTAIDKLQKDHPRFSPMSFGKGLV